MASTSSAALLIDKPAGLTSHDVVARVRRAVGATRRELLVQFLSEAVLISVVGGTAGIVVGSGLSVGIQHFAGIKTIVSYPSVFVAFGVSIAVGLAFGIMPAYRAAHEDRFPTEAPDGVRTVGKARNVQLLGP